MHNDRPFWRADQTIRTRAVALRQESTPTEELLWSRLRNRQLYGLKFRRQHPIGQFIVDFYCAETRLIVEIDGPVHEQQRERDRERASILEEGGRRIIRVTDQEVERDIEAILERIAKACGIDAHSPV